MRGCAAQWPGIRQGVHPSAMRIDPRHLEDVESLPEGVDLPPEQLTEPWRDIADDWFGLTASEVWDDRLLPPAAAAIFRLPMPQQMPRPGAVSSWTHREWIGWATAQGFEEVPRSKHAYQYRHRLAPWLLLSMSSSPGDHRWSMATATDLRFSIDAAIKRLGANLYIAVQAMATNTERHPSAASRERLRLLRHALGEASTDRDAALRWVATHGDVSWENFDRIEPDAETVGAIRALFATLQKEFDLSPRAALRRLGHDQDEAALIAKRVTSSSDLLPGDLLDSLEDLLDGLREERAAHERAKDALRAARPGEEIAAPGAAAPAADPALELRQELRRRIEVLRAAADEAAKLIHRASAEAIALVENAALTPPDEVERLRAENADLRRQLEAPAAARAIGRRRPKAAKSP